MNDISATFAFKTAKEDYLLKEQVVLKLVKMDESVPRIQTKKERTARRKIDKEGGVGGVGG